VIESRIEKKYCFSDIYLLVLQDFFSIIILSPFSVFTLRVVDRIGNGIQASPMDALIAESTSTDIRSICYSLRYCLSIVGSVIGAAIGYFVMKIEYFFTDNVSHYRIVLIIGLIPVITSIFVLCTIKNSNNKINPESVNFAYKHPISFLNNILQLSAKYWILILLAFCFNFSNLSLSFLLFLLKKVGVTEAVLPIIVILKNLACTLVVMPIGLISEKIGKYKTLVIGFIAAISSNLAFCLAGIPSVVVIGVLFMGVQMAVAQGIFPALVAQESKNTIRGTAFGVFHFMNGVAALIANLILGLLWNSSSFAFGLNILVLIFAAIVLLIFLKYKLYKYMLLENVIIKQTGIYVGANIDIQDGLIQSIVTYPLLDLNINHYKFCVTPGFVNSHLHPSQLSDRGMLDGLSICQLLSSMHQNNNKTYQEDTTKLYLF